MNDPFADLGFESDEFDSMGFEPDPQQELQQNLDTLISTKQKLGQDTSMFQGVKNTVKQYNPMSNKIEVGPQIPGMGNIQAKDFTAQSVGSALGTVFPGEKLGNALGTGIAKAVAPTNQKQYIDGDYTAGQILGDSAMIAGSVLPFEQLAGAGAKALTSLGAGAKTASKVSNIGTSLATGYGFDVAGNASNGQENVLTPGIGTALGALPLAGQVAKGVGRVAGEVAGKATGAGFGPINEMFRATLKGGQTGKDARMALRGNVSHEQIINEAKQGLDQIISNRGSEYKKGLNTLKSDKKVYDTKPVLDKLYTLLGESDVAITQGKKGYKLDFERSPGLGKHSEDVKKLIDTVYNWGTRKGDNTIQGVDKLRQKIYEYKISGPDAGRFNRFVDTLYNDTKKLIDNPDYHKMLKGYEESTGVIKEIRDGLSLSDNAKVETGFKKLTTALRQNNDYRKQFVAELDSVTGGNLSSKIAGQQLSETMPRGLAGAITPIAGGAGLATGTGVVPLLMGAVASSPRVVGEVIQALGYTGNKANKVINAIKSLGLKSPGGYLFDAKEAIGTGISVPKKKVSKGFPGFVNPKAIADDISSIGKKKVSTIDSDLVKEAKKYKSAEEFLKTQPSVYHGSSVPLKRFSNKKGGVYFTNSMEDASGYAGDIDNVYEGYLNLKNPLVIDAKGAKWNKLNTKWGNSTQEIVGNAQKDGYDGVEFKNIVDNVVDTEGMGESTVYYVYKPETAFVNESQLTDIWNKANKK